MVTRELTIASVAKRSPSDRRAVAEALARHAGGATVKAIAPPRRPDVERREIETGAKTLNAFAET
jgi:hypothetical protein